MIPTRIRTIQRWVHIALGLTLLCYVYSPWHVYVSFQVFVKFVVIPAIVVSGLWLWKANFFNKLFGIK